MYVNPDHVQAVIPEEDPAQAVFRLDGAGWLRVNMTVEELVALFEGRR